MPSLKTFGKDPNEILDYTIDWSNWISSGDTIQVSSWSITGPDAVLGLASGFSATINSSLHQTTAWVSSGTTETVYKLTNFIITANSRSAERSVRIACQDF